jgi:hypothetical protein
MSVHGFGRSGRSGRDVRRWHVLQLGVLVAAMAGCMAQTRSPRWEASELPRAIRASAPAAPLAPGGSTAPATDAGTSGASLATLLRAVAERNPMVEAARRRWLAATYKRPQMVALPDPKLEYKYFVQQMAREEEQ